MCEMPRGCQQNPGNVARSTSTAQSPDSRQLGSNGARPDYRCHLNRSTQQFVEIYSQDVLIKGLSEKEVRVRIQLISQVQVDCRSRAFPCCRHDCGNTTWESSPKKRAWEVASSGNSGPLNSTSGTRVGSSAIKGNARARRASASGPRR